MRRPHDPQLETRDALLLGWVEGDLTAEQKSSFEAMCKADPALAKLAEKLKADRLAMRSLPEAKAPEHLWRSALAAADGADSAVDGDLADGAPAPLPMRTHGAPGPGLWLLRGAIAAGLLIASSLVIIHLSGPWGPLNEPMHHSMERRDGEGIAERPDKPAGLTPADRDSIVAHGGGRREAAEEGVAGALTARRDGVDPGALQLADRHDSTHDEGTHGLQEADAAMAFQFGQDRLEGFEADEVELLLAALEDDPVLNAVRFNYFEFDADSQELAQMDDGQFEELPNRITLVVEASDVAATIRQVSAWALDHGGQLLAAREIDVLESEQTRTKLEQVIIQRDQSRFDTPGRGEGIARHQVMPDEAYERRMGLREYENIVPPEEVQRVRGAIERQSGFDSRPQGQAYARGAPLNSRPLTIELDTEQLAGLFEQIAADEAVTVVMDSQNMARAQVAYDSLQDRDAIAGARRTLTRHTEMAVPPAESESPLDRANGRPSGALTPEVPIESTPPPAQTGERMADARGRPAIMSESERPGLDIARGRVQSTITMENGGLVGSLRMNAAHWQRVVQHAALNQRFIGDHWHAEDAGMGGAAGGLSLENGRSVDLEREKADLRDVPAPGDAPRARPGVGADPITEPPAPTTDTDRAGAGLEAQDTAVAPRRLADTETGGSRAGGIAELRSRVADSQSQHGRRSGRNVIVEVLVIPRQQVDELIEAQRRIENR